MRIAPDARVLVVDDNETNLLVAKSLLKRTKVKLDTALSGAKCIELLENNRAWFLYKKLPQHLLQQPKIDIFF